MAESACCAEAVTHLVGPRVVYWRLSLGEYLGENLYCKCTWVWKEVSGSPYLECDPWGCWWTCWGRGLSCLGLKMLLHSGLDNECSWLKTHNWAFIKCSVQLLSRVRLFVTPWTVARQASLSITTSWSLSKPVSIMSVMPSNHLILCHPLLLLPSIFPSIRCFPVSQLSASGGRSIGVSASASVPPMDNQDWSPLGWTGWISLQSQGLKCNYYINRRICFLTEWFQLLVQPYSYPRSATTRPRATLHPRDNALYFFCLQDPAQCSAFTWHLIRSFDNTNSVNMGRALVLKNQSTDARDALLERCKEI